MVHKLTTSSPSLADFFPKMTVTPQTNESISLPSLRNSRVIVTGGARGLGESAARILAQQGAKIVIFDVRDDIGNALAKDLSTQFSTPVSYLHVDVSKKAEVTQAVDEAVRILGGLDSLFHSAGISQLPTLTEDVSEEVWDLSLNVNLKGTIFLNQAVFPYLKENNGGNILNVGSDAGIDPGPMLSTYASTKAAVHCFTKICAKEWGKYNIRVNALLPIVYTPMTDEHRIALGPEAWKVAEERFRTQILLGGRFGDADADIAPVVAFLMSDGSRYMTGQLIPVNGGAGMVR